MSSKQLQPRAGLNLRLVTAFLVLFCATNTATAACPDGCFCFTRIIECSNFDGSLSQFDVNINELSIRDSSISVLRKGDISRYTQLTSLTLKNCNMEQVDSEAFSGLASLKDLDLSQNKISRIESHTFAGLDLNILHLAGNPGIILSPGAFQGIVGVTTAFLGENGIQSLEEETFWPLARKVKNLHLNDNSLTTISKSMKPFFDTIEGLNLHGNPFVCDCALEWLYREVGLTPAKFYKNPSQIPACAAPSHVQGRLFTETTRADICHRPEANVTVSFDAFGEISLTCHARGHPLPNIVWTKPNGVEVVFRQGATNGKDAVITIPAARSGQVDTAQAAGVYSCTADNNAGTISTFVNLSWPFIVSASSQSGSGVATPSANPCETSGGSSGTQGANVDAPRPEADPGVLYRKQFTLLELLFAVFGVFVGTLVLSVLLMYFCHTRRRKHQSTRRHSHGTESGMSAPGSDCSAGSMAKIPGGHCGSIMLSGYPNLRRSNNATPTNTSASLASNGGAGMGVAQKFIASHHAHQPSMDRGPTPIGGPHHPLPHHHHTTVPLFDENHYMTTNLEDQPYMTEPCESCKTSGAGSNNTSLITGSVGQQPKGVF